MSTISVKFFEIPSDIEGLTLKSAYTEQYMPFKIIRFDLEPGKSTISESHPSAELWVVYQGKGIIICNNQEREIEEGGLYYIKPFDTHYGKNTGSEILLVDAFFWLPEKIRG